MKNTTRFFFLPLLVGLAACETPVGPRPTDTGASFTRASDACQDVAFTVTSAPISDFAFSGTMSGDLEGTVVIEFSPGSVTFTGRTLSVTGTAHWVVTGGVIAGLSAFETELQNRNLLVDRPGSPGAVYENIGGHRSVSGVESANLTYFGTFSLLPEPQAIHDYRGVICR